MWSKAAKGETGIGGNETRLFGVESDGQVVAWAAATGERAWEVKSLQWRRLTAPLALGRSVVVGDEEGWLHLLSREDGQFTNRLKTDGSAIAAAPVVAGNTLLAVTREGGVFAFRPQ